MILMQQGGHGDTWFQVGLKSKKPARAGEDCFALEEQNVSRKGH